MVRLFAFARQSLFFAVCICGGIRNNGAARSQDPAVGTETCALYGR